MDCSTDQGGQQVQEDEIQNVQDSSQALDNPPVPGSPQREARLREGLELCFKHVTVASSNKEILKNVYGTVSPGQLMAVMGPSGSGKTTLLSTLAGRMPLQSGEVTLDGLPLSKNLKRKICYVLQQDCFFPNLTLLETLTFTSILRLPDEMPRKQKINKMEDLIDELDLRRCLATNMGGMWIPGLSGGETKRASIACELITDPAIILLDEPTSGLDYKTAFNLIKTLKKYTEVHGKTVIMSIHQPSSRIFYQFDMLLLLCDGHTVYYGPPRQVTDFFTSVGYPMQPHYNPADFILEKLKESEEVKEKIITAAYDARNLDVFTPPSTHISLHDLELEPDVGKEVKGHRKWNMLPQKQRKVVKKAASDEHEPGSVHVSLMELDIDTTTQPSSKSDKKWPTGFWTQYTQLTKRTFKQSKSKLLDRFTMFQTIFLCALLSIVWYRLQRTEDTLRDRMGLIFYISMHWGFTPLFDAVISFPVEKAVIHKERAAGWYRLSAYYLAKMTSELPAIFIQPLLFLTAVYWIVGLNGVTAFFAMIGTIFVHSITGQSIGLCIGIYAMDMRRGISLATVIIMFIMLIGGFYTRHLPGWLDWMKYLAFLHYTFHCLLYLEFTGPSEVSCAMLTSTTQSNFESCHLANRTTIPSQELLLHYGIDQPFLHYFLPLFIFLFAFRILGYLLLLFYQKPH